MFIASDSRDTSAIATVDIENINDEGYSGHAFTQEQNGLIHNAAVNILNGTHLNLYNHLKKEDKHKEGIVNTKAAQRVIEERRVPGVDPNSISLLIQKCDKQNRGFLVITEFLKMIE